MNNKPGNSVYVGLYGVFQLLPIILAGLFALGGLVFGIVDADGGLVFSRMGVGAVFLWMLIGVAAGSIVFFFVSIIISPIVVSTDALLELRRAMQSASPVPMAGGEKTVPVRPEQKAGVTPPPRSAGVTPPPRSAGVTPPPRSVEKTEEVRLQEEYALRWQAAKVTHGVRIGRCPTCGKKKQELLHAEFNDFFGKAEYDICFSCFLARKATPKKK